MGKTSTGAGGRNATNKNKKMAPGPQRLLKEPDIYAIYDHLCEKCRAHCDGYVHLTCGREG